VASAARAYSGGEEGSADDVGGDDGDSDSDSDDDDDDPTSASSRPAGRAASDSGSGNASASRGSTKRKESTGASRASTGGGASASASGGLRPGSKAPAFELAGDDGQTWSLASLRGQRFVIYFYPRDNTPGCTTQACDFRDAHDAFTRAGIRVFGVSSDSLASHRGFRDKYRLPFVLLADPGNVAAKAFGVIGEKKLYGRTTIGTIRSTFVIGPTGEIEHTVSPVRVPGHVDALRASVA